MRILVTGAKGMLGTALLPRLAGEHEVVGVDNTEFDISHEAAVHKALREMRPEFVFHLAAYTNVDGCEDSVQIARQVNAQGTRNVAKSCAEIGAVMLYVSTDYVFDGSLDRFYHEDDTPHPLSVYGQAKLWGEQHVQALLARHLIVRSSWLYGPRGKNFVATILKVAREREELRVVGDQRGSPTYTLHLAAKLAQMLSLRDHGIYHVTGAGNCTWFEFAQEIVRLGGWERVRVVPISTREYGSRAWRPANSVLENRRLLQSGLGALPHWTEGLADYLKEGQRLGEFICPATTPPEISLPCEAKRL